jgi:hypothetical protein
MRQAQMAMTSGRARPSMVLRAWTPASDWSPATCISAVPRGFKTTRIVNPMAIASASRRHFRARKRGQSSCPARDAIETPINPAMLNHRKAFQTGRPCHESLIALLDEAGHRPVEAEQSITAISADYGVADALGLASGAPALKIHRIMRDAEGLPVQDITATYRADRFQYQMRLSRGSNPDWQDDI